VCTHAPNGCVITRAVVSCYHTYTPPARCDAQLDPGTLWAWAGAGCLQRLHAHHHLRLTRNTPERMRNGLSAACCLVMAPGSLTRVCTRKGAGGAPTAHTHTHTHNHIHTHIHTHTRARAHTHKGRGRHTNTKAARAHTGAHTALDAAARMFDQTNKKKKGSSGVRRRARTHKSSQVNTTRTTAAAPWHQRYNSSTRQGARAAAVTTHHAHTHAHMAPAQSAHCRPADTLLAVDMINPQSLSPHIPLRHSSGVLLQRPRSPRTRQAEGLGARPC
jgi:hypothetical protein